MQNTWEWYPKKEITSLIGEGIIQPTTLTFFREKVKSRVSIFPPFQHCVDEYSGHAPKGVDIEVQCFPLYPSIK